MNNIKNKIKKNIPIFLFYRLIFLLRDYKFQNKFNSIYLKEYKGKIPSSILKQSFVYYFGKKYNLSLLVETGTYLSEMLISQRNNFKKIFSIEISDYYYDLSKKICAFTKNISILKGDSSTLLPTILSEINEPALFWLDGHYSGGGTGIGELESPIKKELSCIFSKNMKNIILIDDAHLFNGTEGYLTMEELEDFSRKFNYEIILDRNIIICKHCDL